MEKLNFAVPVSKEIIDVNPKNEVAPETLDLHNPELWEKLEILKEEDPDAYYKKIDQIVCQREAEHNQITGSLEQEVIKSIDDDKLNIDDLYKKEDDIYDMYGKYADLAKKIPTKWINKKPGI